MLLRMQRPLIPSAMFATLRIPAAWSVIVIAVLQPAWAVQARPEVDLTGAPLCATEVTASAWERSGQAHLAERFIYLTGGNGTEWGGVLRKFAVKQDAAGIPEVSGAPAWDAALALTGSDAVYAASPQSRNMFMASINAGAASRTIPFRWEYLNSSQKAMLDTLPGQQSGDGMGELRMEYLRGMRNLENDRPGGIFRARQSLLGDIVGGIPVYAPAPSPSLRGEGYQAFFDTYRKRTHAVYAATGSGMLHAFDAASGAELFAYLPAASFPDLARLTAPAVTRAPRLAPSPAVGEATVGGRWKTVLAAGMGAAAQGVFALDVTDPTHFGSEDRTLFEFTDADDPDIGNILAAPAIARFKTRTVRGVPEYRYFIVVSGGFNTYRSDGTGRFNPAAPGVLFLLALDKSPSAKWEVNVNYYKFSLPAADPALPNAMGPPALVTGMDGAVRYAYAGDLQGNLWRFNFTGTAPWKDALGSAPATPLFTAMDSANTRQPVTVRPRVVFAPQGGYVVLFGTGKLIEGQDAMAAHYRTQSYYAIRDTTGEAYVVAGRSALAQRTAAKTSASQFDALAISGPGFRYGAAPEDRKGWYLDFMASAQTGERSVSDAVLSGSRVVFATQAPGVDRCASATRTYVLNALTGLADGDGANGLATKNVVLGTVLPLEIRKRTGGGADARTGVGRQYFAIEPRPGAAAPVLVQEWTADPELASRRLGWREIVNWWESRDAGPAK